MISAIIPRVYQGGNWNHLHRLLSLKSGAYLLYVGDHMYSDILRSKRTLGWRTLLIVPEIASELADAAAAREATAEVIKLTLTLTLPPFLTHAPSCLGYPRDAVARLARYSPFGQDILLLGTTDVT